MLEDAETSKSYNANSAEEIAIRHVESFNLTEVSSPIMVYVKSDKGDLKIFSVQGHITMNYCATAVASTST